MASDLARPEMLGILEESDFPRLSQILMLP